MLLACLSVPLFLSRGSSGRERNDKPLSSGPSRPGSSSVAGAGKEAPEEPPQEEVHKETNVPDTPKLLPSTASRSKLERSQSRESGESRMCARTCQLCTFSIAAALCLLSSRFKLPSFNINL